MPFEAQGIHSREYQAQEDAAIAAEARAEEIASYLHNFDEVQAAAKMLVSWGADPEQVREVILDNDSWEKEPADVRDTAYEWLTDALKIEVS